MDYDDMPDWVDDNIQELAIDFIEWLEATTREHQRHEDGTYTARAKASNLWEEWTLERFDDFLQGSADEEYDRWKDDQLMRG